MRSLSGTARKGGFEMVQAYVLIQAEVGKAGEVVAKIRDISGVIRVDAVTGGYEAVVLAEASDMDALAKIVVGRIQLVPGITRTVTCTIVHL
jgi:DNA-binding Lrp family transcriptional regulator